MVTKSQKIRVGIFISVISIVILYLFFILVGKKLLTQEDIYYVLLKKQSVTGLTVGQDVRYYGINIGKITDIAVDPKDVSQIIITISIKKDTPIKKTVTANLNFLGITGLKIIELTGGENKDKNLNPGDFIQAGQGALDNITGKAEVISEKIELVLNNIINLTDKQNQNKFVDLASNLNKAILDIDTLVLTTTKIIHSNTSNLNNIVSETNKLIVNLNKTTNNLNIFLANTDKTLNSKDVKEIIKNIERLSKQLSAGKIDEIFTGINSLSDKLNSTTMHIDKTFLSGRKNLLKSVSLLKETLQNINDFVIILKDNPDILLKGKNND